MNTALQNAIIDNCPVQTATEPIAIVGMACRYPGAPSLAAFWQLLCQGRDAITEVPGDRWEAGAYYDPAPGTGGKMNTRYGGFVADMALFDPVFFGITPHEAAVMDPQQRLLLEVTWEALENAGLTAARISGSQTGVFVGAMNADYGQFYSKYHLDLDACTTTGNAHSIAANRISYTFNLQGPSIAVDTACSSSLVAITLACDSLRHGSSSVALAGGVNLILTPDTTIACSQAGMMASDGRCKTFDDRADGFVRSEGVGMLVLKRWSDALRDGDPVAALIRGTAINQDGLSNGLTAPNGPSQQAVIRAALRQAALQPSQISCLEAHGTGTPLGDPIEVSALKAVLGEGRRPDQKCALSSLKTNIGHSESAAGVGGIIKVALALSHRKLPAHLHLDKLNKHISLDNSPFYIPTTLTDWEHDGPRYAGVSSFGFGGTNAHVVLEEAPVGPPPAPTLPQAAYVLPLSAKSAGALQAQARQYLHLLQAGGPEQAGDICYAAATHRSHFAYRRAFSAPTFGGLTDQLAAFGAEEITVPAGRTGSPRVAFLFSGQGSQYAGMARGLYDQNAVFRQALDQCHSILLAYLDAPLLSVLFGDQAESALIHETSCTQPALSAIEYALAQMWLSWGIKPYAVMGHSVGEYAAACIAGVFPLEDGLKLIAARGRLMQSLPKDGQMAVVFGDEADVAGPLAGYADRVSVAALNGPANTVISGEREALSQVRARLQGKGIATKALTVSHAFHSHLLEPMLDAFYEVASQVRFSPPAMKMVSNLSGEVAAGEVTTAAYWCRHARQTTLFAAGMQTLEALRCTAFLEIGPQPVLAGMGQSCLPRVPARQWIASLRRGHDDWPQVLLALGGLYTAGAGIDWPAFYQGQHFNKVTLPTYPFQRQRYWLPDKYDLSSLAGKSRGDAPLRPDAKAAGSGAVPGPSPAALSGETGKQPAQATVPEIVRTLIQHQLAETKDLAGDAFDQVKEMPLQDLGLDSLMLMGIRAEIIHRFPAVKNMPMNLFFDDSTLQQILDYVEAHAQPGETAAKESESLSGFLPAAGPLMAEWENEFVPGVILRIDKHLAHKDYDRNVLVGRTQQVAADVFLAEMNQDTGHTFFYEHPKDHVTSMYLLEAISQLGRAVPHLYYEVPLETAFIIHDLETRFEQFAETTQPVFMLLQVADKVYKAGRLTHIQIECLLLQAGKVFGQVKGTGQFMVAEVYNTLRNIT